MHTITAKRIIETYPDMPVAIQYIDSGSCEAFARFPSLLAALQALYYDASVWVVLAVTIYTEESSLVLKASEIHLLLHGLYENPGVYGENDNNFPDLGKLAHYVAKLPSRSDPTKRLAVRINGRGIV